jgi:hypothetical protein
MTARSIATSKTTDMADEPLNHDSGIDRPLVGGDTLLIESGIVLTTNGNGSDVIYATGFDNWVVVGGTLDTTGAGSRGIYFEGGGAAVGLVHTQKVTVLEGGKIIASGQDQGAYRIGIFGDWGQRQRLVVQNDGVISGTLAIAGTEFDDSVTNSVTGVIAGAIDLGVATTSYLLRAPWATSSQAPLSA